MGDVAVGKPDPQDPRRLAGLGKRLPDARPEAAGQDALLDGDQQVVLGGEALEQGDVERLVAEHDLLVTVEEGVLAGGFGSGVWEALSEAGESPRILRIGLPDRFVTHGAPKLLHAEVGFTAEAIAERIESAVLDPRSSLAGA